MRATFKPKPDEKWPSAGCSSDWDTSNCSSSCSYSGGESDSLSLSSSVVSLLDQ